MSQTFILIDGHALLYRAYHAFPPLTTSDGTLVNALYGFARIMLTLIKDLQPKYIAVAFDLPAPTFRHTDFAAYKAQRAEMPTELQLQIDLVKQLVEVLNIPQFAIEGYEADDVIGTLARQCCEHAEDLSVLIATGDKDSFQLVTDTVHVWMPGTRQKGDQEYGPAEVEAKMGVRPDQIIDLKALAGDASDNIPGVKGIGAKTAAKLLNAFGSVETLYEVITGKKEWENTADLPKGATLEKLINGYDSAMMSQKLATIDTQVPIKLDLDKCAVAGYDKDSASKFMEKFEFNSLIKLLPPDDFELGVQNALF